ncbi:hypothetical protein C5167_048610 [Papaver somniferum]|uniref:Uncharacterized protein n=1 Tax=Papaver somniferum TaxID=3469 RepID=A0A4Y7KLT9_PAPSO|nr:hypothetical protein C5167_048610 [Papaver somniferum]
MELQILGILIKLIKGTISCFTIKEVVVVMNMEWVGDNHNSNNNNFRDPHCEKQGEVHLLNHSAFADEITRKKQSNVHGGFQGDLQWLSGQFDHPGPPPGSNLHSVPASAIEESQVKLDRIGEGNVQRFMTLGNRNENNNGIRQHNNRHDKVISITMQNRVVEFTSGKKDSNRLYGSNFHEMFRLNRPFLEMYESLIPPEEEKAKQCHLIASLEKLVNSEWPGAQLYLYGSCAKSFGVAKRRALIEKLAEIFEANNLENVKLCSYAYPLFTALEACYTPILAVIFVVVAIIFCFPCKPFPVIAPTYIVNVDEVENLRKFGAGSIAYLVWAFFDYWAHRMIMQIQSYLFELGAYSAWFLKYSKRAKDWTRRIGNDRHLICVEDPFETSHALGRIVDKFTIKTIRAEFDGAG